MKREIKFRVWDKDDKKMINIGRIDIADGTCRYYLFEGKFYDYWNDVEIMQYTGLKDKNGKEIYEGDILQFTDNYNTDIPPHIGVVKFNNASFYITDGAYSCYRWIDINVEIIGNIYENPELIK